MDIEKLKSIMKRKNISIYRLSKLSGISDVGIGKIIRGKRNDPKISTVKAIAKALEVSINEII